MSQLEPKFFGLFINFFLFDYNHLIKKSHIPDCMKAKQ